MRSRYFSIMATLLLASTALISDATAAPPRGGGGGGGGAPHPAAAAAPHMAPAAPHVAAPHMAAPAMHAAPHVAAPHVAAPHMASPRMASPRMASPRMATRHVAGPRSTPHGASPAFTRRNSPSFTARGTNRANVAQHGIAPSSRTPAAGNAANQQRGRNGRSTVGAGTPGRTTTNGSAANLPTRTGAGSNNRILRNAALTNLATSDPRARNLANATFRGRFAQSAFARGGDRRRHFGFVLGFVGPLFWPYAYDDFVDYTFWPDAYDTFWPYAYDDVFEGLYGAYAPQYGAQYAYAGAPASSSVYRSGDSTAGGGAQVCSDQAQGLTNFPIDQIARQVSPNQQQQGLLDDLKAATAKAVKILQAACPNDLPSTPTGRLAAMHVRVQAMLQAVQAVRPALDKFYDSLSDEQKERFNGLDQNAFGNAPQPDVAQLCGTKRAAAGTLPMAEIEKSLRLNGGQETDLKALDEASAKSSEILSANCPTGQTLTPPGRVAAMEQRLNGMLQAIETVRPALNKFYGSLSDEQKARFDRLGRKRT